VRSSCYLWLVNCTFTLLILTCVLYVRLVTFDLCTQVKSTKMNVQYTSQRYQYECTVHKSNVTRQTYSTQVKSNTFDLCTVRSPCWFWLVYCTFVLLLLTCALCVRLVTFDLCTVRSSCYFWLVYCAFSLLLLTCVLYVHLVNFDLSTVLLSCYFWPMYYAFVLLLMTCVLYVRLVTYEGNKTYVQYIGQR
jgi:cytochrome b subunit of formate dehydrogenase